MSDIHPSVGEGKSHDDMIKFWEDYSQQYSGEQQGDIPKRIVDRLFEVGVFQGNDCIMEIGSGPGTYSLEIAPRARILVCMDSSPSMLDRLKSESKRRGITNIECFVKDWTEYVPSKGYDACIATLCPGTGSPESIERMEATARRSCALVSWVVNHGDDLDAMIWKELGKDYGYGFRSSTAVQDWLSENGRDSKVEFFKTEIVKDIPISALAEKERAAFAAYGKDIDAEGIIRKVLGSEIDGDILHYRAVNEMKLIYWDSE